MKDDLKVGNRVYTDSRYTGPRIITIERETPTRWVTEGGSQWRKKDGYLVGGDVWDSQHIEFATDEHEAEVIDHQNKVKRIAVMRKIREINKVPNHLSVERLTEIYNELVGATTPPTNGTSEQR